MRRMLLSLFCLSCLGLVGCHHTCAHGVCDCVFDDHCCTRAPWIAHGPAAVLGRPLGAVDAYPIGSPMPSAREMPKGLPSLD